MAHNLEFFEHFFEHGEEYGSEERLEMLTLWYEFMKENQHEYGFSDDDLARNKEKLDKFRNSTELWKLTRRLMAWGEQQQEAAARRMDEKLIKAMEANDGKPIPMFPELLKKRGGN